MLRRFRKKYDIYDVLDNYTNLYDESIILLNCEVWEWDESVRIMGPSEMTIGVNIKNVSITCDTVNLKNLYAGTIRGRGGLMLTIQQPVIIHMNKIMKSSKDEYECVYVTIESNKKILREIGKLNI